jgi:hypothetical protein
MVFRFATGGRLDPDAIADELYGLDPDRFTARRDELAAEARRDGDNAAAATVKAFKRPSISAWAVNMLIRERGDEVGQLLQVGSHLRDAQARLSGGELRDLNKQRQAVVRALAREAKGLAGTRGHPLSGNAERQVEETLSAALADEAAGAAVASGRLIRALEPAGLDAVDLAGATAGPGSPVPRAGVPSGPPRQPPMEDRGGRRRKQLEEARAALAAARQEAERAGVEAAEAQGHVAEADGRLAHAEGELRRLEAELRRAQAAVESARGERDAAARRLEAARRAAQGARERELTQQARLSGLEGA